MLHNILDDFYRACVFSDHLNFPLASAVLDLHSHLLGYVCVRVRVRKRERDSLFLRSLGLAVLYLLEAVSSVVSSRHYCIIVLCIIVVFKPAIF